MNQYEGECYDLRHPNWLDPWHEQIVGNRRWSPVIPEQPASLSWSWDFDECNVGPTKSLTFILLLPGAEQGCHALRLFQHTELEHTPSNLYQEAIMGVLS